MFIFRKNDILVLAWSDRCSVMLLNMFVSGSKNWVAELPSKCPNKPSIKKPNVVLDYIEHVGGVNCRGHYIVSY
jgi:hypothetical protein